MAIDSSRKRDIDSSIVWEEESGLLGFLRTIQAEVKRFNDTFDLGVEMLPGQPDDIDGSTEDLKYLGFVVLRKNRALIGRDYCLYSILRGKALHGYIGVYKDGAITTARELNAIMDYRKAQAGLPGWLRDLVKASCEKI
jgi:hypothetical protein